MILATAPFQKAAVFVLMAFSLHVIDIPVWLLLRASNPKTCCGRAICQCTHAKGAFCPIRHAKSERAVQPVASQPETARHEHCHLKRKPVVPAIPETGSLDSEKATGPGWKKAPCHSEKSPVASSPSAAREFLGEVLSGSHVQPPDLWYPPGFHDYLFSLSLGIDHPPRFYFS